MSNTIWNLLNSLGLILLTLFVTFTYGEFPTIKSRIDELEIKVQMMDYHLQCSSSRVDTIVINAYLQQQLKQPINKK